MLILKDKRDFFALRIYDEVSKRNLLLDFHTLTSKKMAIILSSQNIFHCLLEIKIVFNRWENFYNLFLFLSVFKGLLLEPRPADILDNVILLSFISRLGRGEDKVTVRGDDKLTGRVEEKVSSPVLGEDKEERTSFPASVKVKDWDRFISSSGSIRIPWASSNLKQSKFIFSKMFFHYLNPQSSLIRIYYMCKPKNLSLQNICKTPF